MARLERLKSMERFHEMTCWRIPIAGGDTLADVPAVLDARAAGPEDAEYGLRNIADRHGFHGASPMKRLPMEKAPTNRRRGSSRSPSADRLAK